MSRERCTKLFCKLHSKPKQVSELKVTKEDMEQFFADPVNKTVLNFIKRLM